MLASLPEAMIIMYGGDGSHFSPTGSPDQRAGLSQVITSRAEPWAASRG